MYKYGESVIFQDEKYSYEGTNPDGSLILRKWGSTRPEAKISAPANSVRKFLREGRTDTSSLNKLNG